LRYLVISDIHANWEALEAVLAAAEGQYERIICCGDLVGYGADPNAVVDWVRARVHLVVRGNHDRAAVGLEDLDWFNPSARTAALWTLRELTPENIAYVRALPKGPLAGNGFHVVHGSLVDEDEYVLDKMSALQALHYATSSLTFFGHTHVQGGFAWRRGRVEPLPHPAAEHDRRLVEFDPEAVYLLNPGSVGQPRDGDSRAAFALYDSEGGYLWLHRLSYDIEKAQTKIRRAGLPPVLADRLSLGR
jgi:predicted phosphodiesterase